MEVDWLKKSVEVLRADYESRYTKSLSKTDGISISRGAELLEVNHRT